MIRFNKLRYRNILSSGNIFTELDLSKHQSTLIVGHNGAGKTTLIDALCFALYNKPLRLINKPQLINSRIQKDLVVEVEFETNGVRYMVRRGMKPNIFEIHRNDEMIDQDSDSKDYQGILEKQILRMNFKTFTQIVILGSTDYVPFMKLTANARREVVEDLLDIQIFSTMNSLLKDKLAANKAEQMRVETEIRIADSKLDLLTKFKQQMAISFQETIDAKKEKIASYKSEMIELQTRQVPLVKALDTAKKNIEKVTVQLDKLAKLYSTRAAIQAKLERLSNTKDVYSHGDCPTCQQTIASEFREQQLSKIAVREQEMTDKIAQINTKIESGSKLSTMMRVCEDALSKAENEYDNWSMKVRLNDQFQKDLQREIEKLQTEQQVKADKPNEQDIETIKGTIEALEKRNKELVDDLNVMTTASALLKDGGIKTNIVRQYVPVMNSLINKYLEKMDFYINFEFDENFNETFNSRHRSTFSYNSFSQGEKIKINLAILFAWRDIAKMRNSSSTSLLIMDEIFDSSLDVYGTDEFMRTIGTDFQNTNIFIISHKTDSIIDKFQHVLTFQKKNNFSQLVEG